MVDTSNFIVRTSGKHQDNYYIDYVGLYKLADIAKATKVSAAKIKDIYLSNGGILDESVGVYYFDNVINAKKTISDIFSNMSATNKGRVVTLTEKEIEYIRMALINEGSGNVGINSKLKDAIFKKLNG